MLRDGKLETLTATLSAIPSEALADAGAAQRPEGIGLALTQISPQMREQLDLPPSTKGALVARVQPGSPAALAGLQEGDLILGVGTHAVASAEDAVGAIRKAVKAGDDVALRVMRDGHTGYVAVEVTHQG